MKKPIIDKVCHTIRDTIHIIVDRCKDNDVIVESGTYLGNTAAYIVNHLVDSGKTFKFFTIDNFLYDNVSDKQKDVDKASGYNNYKENIANLGVEKYITTVKNDSISAISIFENSSVFCVFVDDNHHYGHVREQLLRWIPKIRPGGLIIGDDYVGGTKQAYDEVFGSKIQLTGRGGCIIYC